MCIRFFRGGYFYYKNCLYCDLKVLGMEMVIGVFFYGLFGCGKIFVVKVIVNEVGVNFIFVKVRVKLDKLLFCIFYVLV